MKKLVIICTCVLIVGLAVGTALAQTYSYCKDFLESGNPGGWTESWQTYDEEWTMGVGEEVDVDIWINDLPESIISGGAWLDFDPAKFSVVSVEVYEIDSPTTPGPWDPGFTVILPEPDGPGTYFIECGNLTSPYVEPGPGGDIIIAKVRFRREAAVGNMVTITTIPGVDTIVGASLPTVVYDPDIVPNTVIGLGIDSDNDGIFDSEDNCPNHPNGPNLGTCIQGTLGEVCSDSGECGTNGLCSMNQEDNFPLDGNECGDACECEANFDDDDNQDGSDAAIFKEDFGRNTYNDPCSLSTPCTGNLDCDDNVDGSDAAKFKEDFGRNSYNNPCPSCSTDPWCTAYQ